MASETAGASNREVASVLRDVAAALKIKGVDRFQAAAYEKAAAGVAHASVPVRELWRAGRLTDVPGVGGTIAGHIGEWFETGRSQRFDEARSGIPEVVLELVHIPGVGPATALKLAAAGVEDLDDLQRRLERGDLAERGLSPRMLETIARGIAELSHRPDRLLLPAAEEIARSLISYIRGACSPEAIEVAGSVRRRCATAANVDIAVCDDQAEAVLACLPGYAGVDRIVELPLPHPPAASKARRQSAVRGCEITLHSGLKVTVLVAPPDCYGATLQWLTGSAEHNAALARLAAERGLTLTPRGLFDARAKLTKTRTEGDVYRHLGLQMPPPELRENWGEIEAAQSGDLPRLVTAAAIRGDCHSHTSWSDGRDNAMRMIEAARALKREYLVITDHSYPSLNFAQRAVEISQLQRAYPDIRLVNGLEVNITVEGGLQVPDDVLARHQFCLASIHTGFRQSRDVITKRLLAALAHPSINGIAHPTGRLLLRREGIEADWDAVFDACLQYDKFLEIDGPADRLDLPDHLVRGAVRRGVKLTVDSDAHATEEFGNLTGGIDVARRGWAEPRHILNTLPYKHFVREAHVRD
jgi:DNA polymerase (family X)